MAESIEMGEFSGDGIENRGYEEETFTDGFIQEHNDLLQRFTETFGREDNLVRIESEQPTTLTRKDFIEAVMSHRPIYLSEDFVKRDAEVFFRENPRNAMRHQFIRKYEEFVNRQLMKNVNDTSRHNPYVEEFKRSFMKKLQKIIRERKAPGLEFKIDPDEIKLKRDKDVIKILDKTGKNPIVIYNPNKGFTDIFYKHWYKLERYLSEENFKRFKTAENRVYIDKILEILDGDVNEQSFEIIKDLKDKIDTRYLSNKDMDDLNKQIDQAEKSFYEAKKVKQEVIDVGRSLNIVMDEDDSEEEIFSIDNLNRIETSLIERDDIDLEEKTTLRQKIDKVKIWVREKLRLTIRFKRLREENELNSGKSLKERIRDLYKEHQKVSIAFLVGVVSLVIGSIVTGIVEGIKGIGGNKSNKNGDDKSNDDDKSTTWDKAKKVMKWIADKIISMIGTIITFILNMLKKVVGQLSHSTLIAIGAIISAIIYVIIYGGR